MRQTHVLFIIAALSHYAHADFQWVAPAKGDVLPSGDIITAKWKSTKNIVSPSFKLCSSPSKRSKKEEEEEEEEEDEEEPAEDDEQSVDSGNCGSIVWPDVKQQGDSGSYTAAIAVPPVTDDTKFFLQMKDDFGTTHHSPGFSLSASTNTSLASADSASTSTASKASASGASAASAGASDTASGLSSPNTGAAASDPSSGIVGGTGQASVGGNPPQAPLAAPGGSTVASNASQAPLPPAPAPSSSSPAVLATRVPPPTAAFAVPLSAVGAILLAAGVMGFRQNRKLKQEKEKMALQRSDSEKCKVSYQGDLERGGAIPVPLYMPPQPPHREPRRATRDIFVPPPSYRSRDGSRGYRDGSSRQSSSNERRGELSREWSLDHYTSRPSSRRELEDDRRRHRNAPSRQSSIDYDRSGSGRRHRDYTPSIDECESVRGYERGAPRRKDSTPLPSRLPTPDFDHRWEREDNDYFHSRSRSRDIEEGDHCSTTDSVIDDYMHPSPLIPAPQRLHVRREARDRERERERERDEFEDVDLYDAVASRVRPGQRMDY